MGYFAHAVSLMFIASACLGAPVEKQQAVENFQEIAQHLRSALTDIVVHSASEVHGSSVLREAGEAQQVYLADFLPALRQLSPFLLTDGAEKSMTYEGEVVAELQKAVKNLSLSEDEVIALLLGDDVMQMDGARLEVNLRLLSILVDRFTSSSQLNEMSLAAMQEMCAVAGAAMETVTGITDAVQDAEQIAQKVLIEIANVQGEMGLEEGGTALVGYDIAGDDNLETSRNKREIRLPKPKTKINLGKGWSVGKDGLDYRSGNFHFNARPTFRGIRPSGVRARFTWKFG